MGAGTSIVACSWRSEDNLWVSVLSFLHVGPRDHTVAASDFIGQAIAGPPFVLFL